jgi:lysophospholipase L1-like esterase
VKSITYLALGDSYTIGENVPADDRFPAILAARLEDKKIKADTKIIATTGWTTGNLLNAIATSDITGKKYELVSLLIGVNNQYQGRTLDEYKRQFTQLLNISINFADGRKERVFVVSIPDYGYTPFGRNSQAQISREIDEFNAANKAIADSLGIRYFDITPISRKSVSDPDLVAGDGLHPSAKQYTQWVDLMQDEVEKMLGQ